MPRFLLRWIINALALGFAAWLLAGIQIARWEVLIPVALIFGLINAVIRPILSLLTCPLILLTLGLFTLVINALMLQLTSWISGELGLGFHVAGFWAAFLGALVISVVSFFLSLVLGETKKS